ncbi:hypothetical protein, partial [Pseudomonas sp. SIMBA_021]|uniref:hypothetical protein n=1 Tax=Pseudomonas sp. SIMBA_021 TaxID=3085767 RepID=UPI00397DFE40
VDGIEGFYEGYKQPKLIILSPSYVSCLGQYKHVYEGAPSKNLALSKEFENVAFIKNANFYDLQKIVSVLPIDGVHIEANSHAKIAALV